VSLQLNSRERRSLIVGLWGIRYQVQDVSRAVAFYTQRLGFKLDQQNLPACGQVSVGGLKLILSGPGASGSRPMPDGSKQEPGGWNRIVLQVEDLPAQLEEVAESRCAFSERDGSRPRREANPTRRPRRQPTRTVRASLSDSR
jgi:glyoxylase I family protein